MRPIAHARRLSSRTASSRHAVDAVLVGDPTPIASCGSRIVKPENTRNAVLVGLHPPFRRARPLKWRTGSAILKSLVREHRAHTAFMSTGHPAMHEVQYFGIGVALVTRP